MKIIVSIVLLFFVAILFACDLNSSTSFSEQKTTQLTHSGNTIETRFDVPSGFKREELDTSSFGHWLRELPLKEKGTQVQLFDGSLKGNQEAHLAVIDLPIGSKDLHQCADAIMRLRADYLFSKKKYDEIHFHFTNGFDALYSKWRKGQRIQVNGNKVQWVDGGKSGDNQSSYWQYLEKVFSYAGTLSLSKELKPKSAENIQIGDVFIQGGSPGHAVIVVDLAINASTGEKVFMLAQSYMPAQEIHVLRNPSGSENSPWYEIKGSTLETPEWDFTLSDLKYFP
jgi:hypothetical protein